jgi:hypothetical protein
MVTLADYQDGFVGSEAEGLAELQKAMVAGQITGRDTTNLPLTMEPLKVESLEKTLKLLDYRPNDIKLYQAIPKMTAYNTVEEFLQLQSYGTDRGGFYDEGELSDVEDSTYVRRSEQIKYIQVTGEVTMQAQMVRSYVDAMRKEVENKMMWVTRKVDTSLTKADGDIISQEFNSLYKQHASIGSTPAFLYPNFEGYYNSGVVVDLRGASIKQKDIEAGAVIVDLNYGSANVFAAPTTVISVLSQDYYERQRIMYGGGGNGAITGLGVDITDIGTTLGRIKLMSDKFMKVDPPRLLTDAAISSKAPAAPATVTVASTTDVNAKYAGAELSSGNIFYAVSALNRYGESVLTPIGSAFTLAAGHSSDLTITPGTGANAAQGFVIYRTKPSAASSSTGLLFYPIFKVSNTDRVNGYNGAGAGVVRDCGYFLPDTEQGFMTQMDDEVLSLKQLAPISKLDLAIISMSRRFICFNFVTPNLYAPKKFVRYINIGKTLTA